MSKERSFDGMKDGYTPDDEAERPYSGLDASIFDALKNVDQSSKRALVASLAGNQIRVGAMVFTPTGLQLDGELDRDVWEQTGVILRRLEQSLQWLIGDWLHYGEIVAHGDRQEFAESLGFEVKTIYDYEYVCSKVDFSVRTEELSFGHHKLVAPKEPDEQRYWLQLAVDEGLSVHRLREAMRGAPVPTVSRYERVIDRLQSVRKNALKLSGHERRRVVEELRQLLDELTS